LEIKDSILDKESVVQTRWVINATGIWADTINKMFGIQTPYKHAFGKGVFIGLERSPHHKSHLIIETKEPEGCMAYLPWSHISLWGPTETRINSLDKAFQVNPSDIRFLINELNCHLAKPVSVEDIVSLRCGVRPLVVKNSFSETSQTFQISRKHLIYPNKDKRWISIYGGKLTSCILVAKSVAKILSKNVKPLKTPNFSLFLDLNPELLKFPKLSTKVLSARWCREKEMCWTLEDYLRRRTNISQWVRRGGLGLNNENECYLKELAKTFCGNDETGANIIVEQYKSKIKNEFDDVLRQV
jgi:glycerol-3-phosphate dehydrogenase